MSRHSTYAKELFEQGYNCSQAVFLAFSDVTSLEKDLALKISSSFGGGMGRLREVCGALTGAFMAAGIMYGYSDPKDDLHKAKHYELIQRLAKQFEEENGSLLCRDLLGLGGGKDSPIPETRTKEYYKARPCACIVESAARILDEYMEKG